MIPYSHNQYSDALEKLRKYIEKEEFRGYDPYDTLQSKIKFRWFGKLIPVLAIQFQKRNPINIRAFLGINKALNPKALGLFLYGYCVLQKNKTGIDYSKQIQWLFSALKKNYSKGYSGYCWGYNFDWASSGKYIPAYSPNIVVTAFIAKGIFAYYELTKDKEALDILESTCKFILNDLPRTENNDRICFSYTTLGIDCCYNASLLAALVLSQQYYLTKNSGYFSYAKKAVDYVIDKQHSDGKWNYSLDPDSGKERAQIDFHQGYVIDCIKDFIKYCGVSENKYEESIREGTAFYRNEQFFETGQSKWRLPQEYPVEIHNQSQGIITLTKMSSGESAYYDFAKTIATWTIKHMQDTKGFFYYRKLKFFTNKISYMRWSQAWMFVALTELIYYKPEK